VKALDLCVRRKARVTVPVSRHEELERWGASLAAQDRGGQRVGWSRMLLCCSGAAPTPRESKAPVAALLSLASSEHIESFHPQRPAQMRLFGKNLGRTSWRAALWRGTWECWGRTR